MPTQRLRRLACALSAGLMLSGCAGFRANQLGPVNQAALNSPTPQQTKVYSSWHMAAGSRGDATANTILSAMSKQHFEEALQKAHCCVLVDSRNQADLVVEGTVHNDVDPLAWLPAVITGFSLYLIPSWLTDKVHIEVIANPGATQRTYELRDQMTMVQWLPMLVVLPFTGNPVRTGQAMNDAVFQHLVVRIKQDGLLR